MDNLLATQSGAMPATWAPKTNRTSLAPLVKCRAPGSHLSLRAVSQRASCLSAIRIGAIDPSTKISGCQQS